MMGIQVIITSSSDDKLARAKAAAARLRLRRDKLLRLERQL